MASAGHVHAQPLPPSLPLSSSAHFVINILSAAQPHLADHFARPDRHPHPFEDPRVRYATSQDGLPVLSGTLSALLRRLVRPPLLLAHLRKPHMYALDNKPNLVQEGGREVLPPLPTPSSQSPTSDPLWSLKKLPSGAVVRPCVPMSLAMNPTIPTPMSPLPAPGSTSVHPMASLCFDSLPCFTMTLVLLPSSLYSLPFPTL